MDSDKTSYSTKLRYKTHWYSGQTDSHRMPILLNQTMNKSYSLASLSTAVVGPDRSSSARQVLSLPVVACHAPSSTRQRPAAERGLGNGRDLVTTKRGTSGQNKARVGPQART